MKFDENQPVSFRVVYPLNLGLLQGGSGRHYQPHLALLTHLKQLFFCIILGFEGNALMKKQSPSDSSSPSTIKPLSLQETSLSFLSHIP